MALTNSGRYRYCLALSLASIAMSVLNLGCNSHRQRNYHHLVEGAPVFVVENSDTAMNLWLDRTLLPSVYHNLSSPFADFHRNHNCSLVVAPGSIGKDLVAEVEDRHSVGHLGKGLGCCCD